MKRNKFIIGALCTLMAGNFASCDLTEHPDSYYDMGNYFTTEEKAQMSVVGIYDCIETEGYYGQYVMPFWSADDMFMVRGVGADGTRRDISHYQVTSSNTWILSVWQYLYQGLDRANLAITGIEGMEGYADNTTLQQYAAEARFLRAFLAFDLVRFWGDAPFTTDYTNTYGSAYKPRTDRELIYDQMIEDLNFAKTHLPSRTAVTSESPCRGAAHALLMRVYLQRAGYSLDCESGTLTRPDEATRQNYFNAVIDEWEALQSEGEHNFYNGGYEQLFKNYSQLVLDNQESLWEIAFEPNNGEKDNAGYWGTYNGPLMDAPSGNAGTTNWGRANAFFTVLPYWGEFYESNADGSEKDIRRDVNFVDYAYKLDDNGNQTISYTCNEIAKNLYRYPGKWRREWTEQSFVDPNHTGINYCPLRYADAVLMAAEAYNETGNTAQAWTLLNSVRTRSGATPVTSANYAEFYKAPKVYNLDFIADGDDAGKFRTALYWERAFELCYEGMRKYDLLRWGVLAESLQAAQNYIATWVPGPNEHITDDARANWNGNTWANSNYIAGRNFQTGKHELFPIPLTEIQTNSALNNQNNPGYE